MYLLHEEKLKNITFKHHHLWRWVHAATFAPRLSSFPLNIFYFCTLQVNLINPIATIGQCKLRIKKKNKKRRKKMNVHTLFSFRIWNRNFIIRAKSRPNLNLFSRDLKCSLPWKWVNDQKSRGRRMIITYLLILPSFSIWSESWEATKFFTARDSFSVSFLKLSQFFFSWFESFNHSLCYCRQHRPSCF